MWLGEPLIVKYQVRQCVGLLLALVVLLLLYLFVPMVLPDGDTSTSIYTVSYWGCLLWVVVGPIVGFVLEIRASRVRLQIRDVAIVLLGLVLNCIAWILFLGMAFVLWIAG